MYVSIEGGKPFQSTELLNEQPGYFINDLKSPKIFDGYYIDTN